MFDTTIGKRVLKGAEAHAFAEGMFHLLNLPITIKDECADTNPVFQRMTREQKIHTLNAAMQALLMTDIDPPRRSAEYDSAIDAVFRTILNNIEIEIDTVRTEEKVEDWMFNWRETVLAAAKEPHLREGIFGGKYDPGEAELDEAALSAGLSYWPDRECADKSEWDALVDGLEEAVLEDRDWLMYENFIGLPADETRAKERQFNIEPGYFSWIADDPLPEEAKNTFIDMVLFLRDFLGYIKIGREEIIY